MIAMVLLLRHQLVWKHHKGKLLNYSTNDQNNSIANAEELLKNSCEQIIQKLQGSRDLNLAKGVVKFLKRVTSLTSA